MTLAWQGSIRVYHNIKLRSVGVSTAVAALAEDLREFDMLKQSFTNSEQDIRREQVRLIHSALYHFPQDEDVKRYKEHLQKRIAALRKAKVRHVITPIMTNPLFTHVMMYVQATKLHAATAE